MDPVRQAHLADIRTPIDPAWDPFRAWLWEYRQDGQQITLRGGAASPEDVGQFLKRLSCDVMFSDVSLDSITRDSKGIYEFAMRVRAPGADPHKHRVGTRPP